MNIKEYKQTTRILVVDDEPDLCQILQFNLEANGYQVDVVNSAEEALQLNLLKYNLILLDVMMEKISGFEMLSIIRNEKKLKMPVIFVTAMSSESHLLKGFTIGADDYVRKPFSINEVLVRVKAVLDRYQMQVQTTVNNSSGFQIDAQQKKVFIGKTAIDLTRTEYDILTTLYQQPGKVYSRDDLINSIWSDQPYISDRAVDVNITRIRKKLGAWGKCIVTRSGYGYYFDAQPLATVNT
ncbi:MAG: DNA-binding response regulator [Bacteroidetes bacterium HGW-Bacteroidetes-4]|jgi:DNA-binding response OmpR family regulator|nr:MAG: DNA-binding response regulator [Bacteroidetes bacterium HGW-Bacteroidetes-4]